MESKTAEVGNEEMARQLDELVTLERESSMNLMTFNESQPFNDDIQESGQVAKKKNRGMPKRKIDSKMVSASEIAANQQVDDEE